MFNDSGTRFETKCLLVHVASPSFNEAAITCSDETDNQRQEASDVKYKLNSVVPYPIL